MNDPQLNTPAVSPIAETRDSYINDIREKMNKIHSKMSTMRDEASRLAGDLKKKADENLVKLDAKYRELRGKVETFKEVSEENWNSDKEAFQRSFKEFTANFKGLFT